MLIFSRDSLRQQVEAASGGKVTVLYDDKGYPSYMCVIPKFNIQDVTSGAGSGVHPAFIVNGVEKPEIFVGQYPARTVDGRACSLPGMDPSASINFETAMGLCTAKGAGWHLMTNAEWMALALWSHGALGADAVHGNTYYGRDYDVTHEMARRQDGVAPGTSSGTARTLSGSGPASWRHDGTLAGVSDLVGNVGEWVAGLRLVDGEIQVMPNNDGAFGDHDDESDDWRSILEDGSLVTPGTGGTLKYDADGATGAGNPVLSDAVTSQSDGTTAASRAYKDLTASVTPPDIVKVLGLFPHETDMVRGTLNMRNQGERLPRRGGHWDLAADAGLFALNLNSDRSSSGTGIGFRPAFVI